MVSSKCSSRLAEPQAVCGNKRKEMSFRLCRGWQLVDEKKISFSEALTMAAAEIRANCHIDSVKKAKL